ncbi:hypothetical protein T08_4450 [Trichinella sp. T8]|uniref:Uncharacterized protein n=1 Tax=Trichinella murrelli TaxID=144512 RepID=A0A0V0UGE4_9BILA|nr:hypothetical protein T05_14581 [Trichinella murrelli]KRZ95464.1 hypothetical protein T08_4450 [Trichinella sp. T8]
MIKIVSGIRECADSLMLQMHNYHINIAINGIFKRQLSFSYMLKFICILKTKYEVLEMYT